MNKTIWPLLFTVVALVAPSASGQHTAPVDYIREATWQAYSRYYPSSPLCSDDEITLWSCSVGKRQYALCSSRVVTHAQGYMQYRASKTGNAVFTYPAIKRPPSGAFTYSSYANGNASVEFANNGYRYSLVDPLRSESSIIVEAPSGKTTGIACGGNQTLQVNYTMRLMSDAGIWDR
ncbi:hypothetical protein [Luteimonas yindakuii]|uniref:hypothetical protein n=1 Tax=Luteimonas yindakuii TaxID=2565782 RepID=UPI001FC98FFB|nr:hypothetical protein [Luteimonas yindakuii]